MKTTSRYLAYNLSKNLWRTAVLAVISSVICVINTSNEQEHVVVEWSSTGLYMLPILIGVLAFIIPVLELSAFKNRRNLDALYSFPIDRRKMAAVHCVSGAIQMVAIYTVAFAAQLIYLVLNTSCFALGYMIPYYFLLLLVGLALYFIFCFVFNQGNSVADGVVFCLMWSFVGYIVAWVLINTFYKAFFTPDSWTMQQLSDWYETTQATQWGMVFAPLNNLTVIFQDLIEVNRHGEYYDYYDTYAHKYASQMYMFFIWGAIGIAAVMAHIFGFDRKGAHKAGEPSDSWFGYKTLIPIYGYSILLYQASECSFDFLFVMTIVAMYIGYVVYRRSFKIKKCDVIVLVCAVIPVIVGLLLSATMPSVYC